MNMFKKSKATSVKEYIETVPEERKDMFMTLHEFVLTTVPQLKPYFAYNMIGYGAFKYKNYKGEVLDWPIIALANQKQYISLYVCAVEDGEYIAEKYKDMLGQSLPAGRKVSVGKSCIRIKKLESVNMEVLKTVLKKASKSPGLVGAGEHKK